jgi:hypothetical protein
MDRLATTASGRLEEQPTALVHKHRARLSVSGEAACCSGHGGGASKRSR